jgi:hypothetical protein
MRRDKDRIQVLCVRRQNYTVIKVYQAIACRALLLEASQRPTSGNPSHAMKKHNVLYKNSPETQPDPPARAEWCAFEPCQRSPMWLDFLIGSFPQRTRPSNDAVRHPHRHQPEGQPDTAWRKSRNPDLRKGSAQMSSMSTSFPSPSSLSSRSSSNSKPMP